MLRHHTTLLIFFFWFIGDNFLQDLSPILWWRELISWLLSLILVLWTQRTQIFFLPLGYLFVCQLPFLGATLFLWFGRSAVLPSLSWRNWLACIQKRSQLHQVNYETGLGLDSPGVPWSGDLFGNMAVCSWQIGDWYGLWEVLGISVWILIYLASFPFLQQTGCFHCCVSVYTAIVIFLLIFLF